MVRVGILVLLLNLVGRLPAFHCWVLCDCWFVVNGFYYIEISSLYNHFDESFYHKEKLNLLKCFFINWSDHVSFVLLFVNVAITFICMLNHSCDTGMNWTLSRCMLFVWLVQFDNILLKIFAFICLKDTDLWFFFCSFFHCIWYCMLSIQSCPTLCGPMDCNLPGSSVHRIFPSKNTVVGCHFLLQGIFLIQGLNSNLLCLLHWQASTFLLAPPIWY